MYVFFIQNTGTACCKQSADLRKQFKIVSQVLQQMQQSVQPPVFMNVAEQVKPETEEVNYTRQLCNSR